MKALPAVAALLVAARLDSAGAQVLEPRAVPAVSVEAFTFQSPSMGVRYGINVAIPDGYQPGDSRRYPLLIATDGDWAFPVANATLRMMEEFGSIQPLFIVSIGTPAADGREAHVRRRVFEFSPPAWDMQDPFGLEVRRVCDGFHSEPGRCVGGAPKFLNAIVTELIPLLTAKYRIDPNDLGLFGMSAGGFFAAWAMFQPNSPFKKYLISSPAMAYGNGEVLRQEARYAGEHKDLPVSLYLGAGTLEAADPFLEGVGQIVSGMSHLAGVLATRHYPSLRVVTEYHPGLGHADVLGTTMARGLRVLYPK